MARKSSDSEKSSRPLSARGAGSRPAARQTMPRARYRLHLPSMRGIFRFGILMGIWGFIALFAVLAWYGSELPRLIDTAAMTRKPSITILAEDGTIVARYGDITGAIINASQLPPHVLQAVMAVEDRRFYSHFGIDPIGLARAIFTNLRAGHMVQGGSTITQQLAKNLFLTPERTLSRKIQEAMLAVWLEMKFSKDEIMTAYLNRVYLGAGAYGVDAAARVYFNKSARELTLHESAIIAGLLKAPSRYSPATNPALAEERARTVMQTMVEAGFITEAQFQALKANTATPRRRSGGNNYGRYFADWVMDQVDDFIGDEYGDIVVQTTLRPSLQRGAESALSEQLAAAAEKKVSEGAAIIMSPDGAVRAMVGGKDYDDSQFNRAVQALRQPGSSFKPVIYLTALENAGYTPDSMVEDAPIAIGNYSPDNYTESYAGWIPMREALAKSLNTVAVRLLQEEGLSTAQATARRLGLPTPNNVGLSYALGTAEVNLLQLTAAYASFANGGQAVRPYGIAQIRAEDGRVLWRRQSTGLGEVASPQSVAMLVEMMKGVLSFGTGTAAALPDRMAAGKTGTSQNFRDAWFMGFTADYVGGIWMGNDDNSSMRRVTGGSFPARAWKSMMTVAEAGLPARPLITDSIGWTATDTTHRGPLDAESANPLVESGLIPSEDTTTPENTQPPENSTNRGFLGVLSDLTGRSDVEYTYPNDNRNRQGR